LGAAVAGATVGAVAHAVARPRHPPPAEVVVVEQRGSARPAVVAVAARPHDRPHHKGWGKGWKGKHQTVVVVKKKEEPAVPAAPEPEYQELHVVIPQGVNSGETMTLSLPNDTQADLPVPDGMKPGETLTVWFDPASGTVTF